MRSFVRSFVCLFVAGFCLAEFPCGKCYGARERRNRIYEKTGGKGKEIGIPGRQIGHHRTAKHKEPQEATGVQI